MHPDAEKVNVVSGIKIKWSGAIDLGDFYTKLKLWMVHQEYGDEFKNFKEVKYIQRMKANAREIDIKWVGEKNISDYFSNYVTITFLFSGIKETESVVNGRKVKLMSLSLEIKLFGDLVKNRKGKWKKDSFIKRVYERFVIKDRIDEYKLSLYQKVYSLQDEIKSYLDLQKF